MIVPNKEKAFDKDRPRTTLQELISRHKGRLHPEPNPDGHYSVWTTPDMVDLIKYVGWTLVETQETDDKVENRFTIVVRKL